MAENDVKSRFYGLCDCDFMEKIMILAIILLIITFAILVGSFLVKTKNRTIVCGGGYFATFWLAIACLCKSVKSMTLEQARFINHNAGFCMVFGVVLILIGSILHDWIKKKKQNSEGKKQAAGLLALFGVFVFIASNIMTMTTYIQISHLNMPVVTPKSIDMIFAGQEYTVDDFIEVDNSYGEEFGMIKWAEKSNDDSSDIVINENRNSFKVLAGEGRIHITIWVHESHYSDIQTVSLNVNVNKRVE